MLSLYWSQFQTEQEGGSNNAEWYLTYSGRCPRLLGALMPWLRGCKPTLTMDDAVSGRWTVIRSYPSLPWLFRRRMKPTAWAGPSWSSSPRGHALLPLWLPFSSPAVLASSTSWSPPSGLSLVTPSSRNLLPLILFSLVPFYHWNSMWMSPPQKRFPLALQTQGAFPWFLQHYLVQYVAIWDPSPSDRFLFNSLPPSFFPLLLSLPFPSSLPSPSLSAIPTRVLAPGKQELVDLIHTCVTSVWTMLHIQQTCNNTFA